MLGGIEYLALSSRLKKAERKLRSYATFEDFEAVGDGVADDTTRLQAAFTWANAQSPVAKLFGTPGKTYKVTKQIAVDPAVPVDWNSSTVDGSACVSAYLFLMVGATVEYVQERPWRDLYVNMNGNAATRVFKIGSCVGKVFENHHGAFVNGGWVEYGDNCWNIEFRGGIVTTTSNGTAGLVGTAVYVPAALFNSGEEMRFPGFTFAGFSKVFDIRSGNFDFDCPSCAFDYNGQIVNMSAGSCVTLGGHIESNYDGNWFVTSGADYGSICVRAGTYWLVSGAITNYMLNLGTSTIRFKMDGVHLGGFGNYTPKRLSTGAGADGISYRGVSISNPDTCPRIGFTLYDPDFTQPNLKDWVAGVYDNGGVPAGTVTVVAGAGPTGNNVIRLDPAAPGYVGVTRTLSTVSTEPGPAILIVKLQYKLQAGATDINNALELLTVTNDYSGQLQGYSKTQITNADGTWRSATYTLNIARNADVKFYIEAHDNGGGSAPTFDVSNISVELLA
jgi:hypothetical protein